MKMKETTWKKLVLWSRILIAASLFVTIIVIAMDAASKWQN
jgi:hypothetical protein